MRIHLEEAIALLKKGEVVAIPTETVYGLAADASNPEALQKIYTVKERPATNPLIVHLANSQQVDDWATEFPPLAKKLAQAFWPGPLTLVLNAKSHVSSILTAGQSTVALRVPNHPIALQLLAQSGLALAAPSANKYTQLSPTTAAHVEAGLGKDIPVLEGGASKVGIESTIVHVFQDAQKNWQWQLLRQGMVSEATIKSVAGKSATTKETLQELPKVPGQHALHYSPRTPLHLCLTREALIESIELSALNKKSCAALMFEDDANVQPYSCVVKKLAKNPEEYAEHLYASLHALDALNVEQLFVELPPNENAWLPVLDRLKRAAHSD